MSEDLQHIDDIFRNAIEPYEENPSPAVWATLQAQLDKEDAVLYKRRFFAARRIAFTILFLELSFVIYEGGIYTFNSQKLAQPIEFKNENKNNHDNEAKHVIKAPEKQGTPKNSSTLQQHSFITGNKTESSPQILEKSSLKTEATSLENNNSTKINIRRSRKEALKKYKNEQLKVLEMYANKSNPLYKKNLSNARSITKNHFTKQPNIDKPNNDFYLGKVLEYKNAFFPPTRAVAIQPYQVQRPNLQIQGVTITRQDLINQLSDSINQLVANKSQHKQNQKHYFKPFWTITAIAAPEWAEYNLQNDLSDNVNVLSSQDEKTEIEQREKHKTSFLAGIMTSYQFTKRWAIQTGVLYSNTAIAIQPQTIYAAMDAQGTRGYKYNTSSGYAYIKPNFSSSPAIGDSISATRAQHHLQYLSVPIVLKFKIEKKKISISPGLGFTANLLLGAKILTQVKDGLNKETVMISKLNGTEPFYIGFITNTDIQNNFNKNWSLNFIPGFRYAITPVTKNNVVKTYPYSFSLAVGITHLF